ncbi:MAG: homoserine dehydrogenase [Candidatus Aenigmarchaeota archaeon]|nr:homoserine dehydrogenase [Candidatus Aenigmarchaeota archaeon]
MAIGIGLLGVGNIGTGVAEYLQRHGESLGVYLKGAAVADPKKPRGVALPYVTGDAYSILKDPDVQIVVELIGGEEPALQYVMEAVHRGKDVVTANKRIMAKYGSQIFAAAQKNRVDIGFEASVGGGIPIIQTLREQLAANKIRAIQGIVNGTTNYMLTRMRGGMRNEDALRIAQEKGFAEADPTSDVSGEDAKYKLALLSSVAWNAWVDPEKIPCEGITGITPGDFDYAAEVGSTIKLLATAKKHDGIAEVRVNPALIRESHPLAGVNEEFNAIYVEGDLCGPQMYWGRGAGRHPTTSAVISDIRRIARNLERGTHDGVPSLGEHVQLLEEHQSRGYIRPDLVDEPGSAAAVFGILSRHGINVKDSVQRSRFGYDVNGRRIVPDIITIDPVSDSTIQKVLSELEACERVHGKPFYMRIED